MASPRYLFGSGVSDFAIAPPSRHGGFVVSAANLGNGTLWSAASGGTQYTDLQTVNGGSTTIISTDADGGLAPFYGPPGIDGAWLDFGGGSRAFLPASHGQDSHLAALVADDASAAAAALDARVQAKGDVRYPQKATLSDDVAGVITDPASSAGAAIDGRLASKVAVTDGGLAAGAGGPDRPNVQLGGSRNGSTIESSQIHGVLLQPGGPGFNNIIGGDGTATVNTPTPNVASNVGNVGVSLIGGYDNVAGSISSKIISDHSFTAPGSPGHNGIYGGAGHKATVNASFSMVASGQNNISDAAYAFVTGNGNTVSGTGGAAFGTGTTVSGTYGVSQGNTNTVTGAYGRAQGQLCQVDKNWGSAEGQYAYSRNGSQRAVAAGRISATGDAQTSVTPFLKQTVDATEIKMSPGSGLPDWVMVRGQSVMVEAMFVARTVSGATQGAWLVKTLCAWDAAGASFNLGTPTVETLYSANAALSVRVDAVSSIGAILPKVKGLAGTTINWSCRMTTVEVMA